MGAGLNEVQLSKELQLTAVDAVTRLASASMKCSSRKNCNDDDLNLRRRFTHASMKCSSRKNCNQWSGRRGWRPTTRLNEVQLSKELQQAAKFTVTVRANPPQ